VNQAAGLTKKAEYGHLKLQPVAMAMNQWGSAVCIMQPTVSKQRCIIGSNTTAVPSHALVEYREDVSYNMSKGCGDDPAVQHKSTSDASTAPVVVRMSQSSSSVPLLGPLTHYLTLTCVILLTLACSTHSPSHACVYDLPHSPAAFVYNAWSHSLACCPHFFCDMRRTVEHVCSHSPVTLLFMIYTAFDIEVSCPLQQLWFCESECDY
jgi:hypothetical protein